MDMEGPAPKVVVVGMCLVEMATRVALAVRTSQSSSLGRREGRGTRERLGGNKGGEAFWMEAKACSIYGASYSCWVGRGGRGQ